MSSTPTSGGADGSGRRAVGPHAGTGLRPSTFVITTTELRGSDRDRVRDDERLRSTSPEARSNDQVFTPKIYSVVNGQKGSLLATGSAVTITARRADSGQWYVSSLSGLHLAAGTQYMFALDPSGSVQRHVRRRGAERRDSPSSSMKHRDDSRAVGTKTGVVTSGECRRCLLIGRGGRGGATGCCTRSTRAPTWTPTRDGVGDLRGITERLDHLQWLGVDGIWLDPIMVSPNDDWGYDVADYVDVDPALGSLADADTLIAEAAKRGIRVLLDLVPNHTSDRHPWFVDAKSAPRLGSPRLVRVGRSQARRFVPEQLDHGVRPAPAGVDLRRSERAVLPQPVPFVTARSQLVERRRARRVRRDPALLVRPRCRRLSHRRRAFGHQGPRAARQPAGHARRSLVRPDDGAEVRLQRVPARGARRPPALAQDRGELRPAARAHRRDVRARTGSVRELLRRAATS